MFCNMQKLFITLALTICCIARAAEAAPALSDAFLPPSGFTIEDKSSRMLDFDHEPISSGAVHQEPAGQTWRLYIRLNAPRKTPDEVSKIMSESLQTQGWEVLSPGGLMIAKRSIGVRLGGLRAPPAAAISARL